MVDDFGLAVISDTSCGGSDGSGSIYNWRPTSRPFRPWPIMGSHCTLLRKHISSFINILTTAMFSFLKLPDRFCAYPSFLPWICLSWKKSFAHIQLVDYLTSPLLRYTVPCWTNGLEKLSPNEWLVGLRILHTPSRSPDRMA